MQRCVLHKTGGRQDKCDEIGDRRLPFVRFPNFLAEHKRQPLRPEYRNIRLLFQDEDPRLEMLFGYIHRRRQSYDPDSDDYVLMHG